MNPPLFNTMRRHIQTSFSSSVLAHGHTQDLLAIPGMYCSSAFRRSGHVSQIPAKAGTTEQRRVTWVPCLLKRSSSSVMAFRMHHVEGEMRKVSAQGACHILADGWAVATPILRAAQQASRRLGVFGAWFFQNHLHASPPNRPTMSAFARPCALRALRDGLAIPATSSPSGPKSGRRSRSKIGGIAQHL
jgi:hypothetical protein